MARTTARVETKESKAEPRKRTKNPEPKPSGMVYQFRSGARVRGVPAQVVGERLEVLTDKYGFITPDLVVSDAAPPDAALHPAFEWNDTLAAMEHRKQQARLMIGSVVSVQYSGTEGGDADEKSISVRAFVSVSLDGDNLYTSTVKAMHDPGLREQVLARALAELTSYRQKYGQFRELARIFEAIDQVKETI